MNSFGSKLNTILLIVIILLIITGVFLILENNISQPDNISNGSGQNGGTQVDKREILGNKDDLLFFSISPNEKVKGKISYKGAVEGGYFFEANILINVLDANKTRILQGNTMATSDWMTSGPVLFEGELDFTPLPKGPAYIEIHNDNPSDFRQNDKFIRIPIIIE